MKAFLFFLSLTLLAGCSQVPEQKWVSYYKAVEARDGLAQQKQFDLALTEDGKVKGITIYAVQGREGIAQPKEEFHPLWGILGTTVQAALPYAGFAVGAHVIGQSLEGIVQSGRGAVSNSYNSAGQNYAGGDMSTAGDTITSSYNPVDTQTSTVDTTTSTTDTNTSTTTTSDASNQGNTATTLPAPAVVN